MTNPPDVATELMIVADITLKTASVLGRLAKRAGHRDLADELADLMDRTLEVIELEQILKGKE